MLSPYQGFEGRSITGVYKIAAAAFSGLALVAQTSDASPLTPSPYGNSLGTLVPGSVTTGGIQRETGWLLQPVTTSGPTVLEVLSSVYDESVAAGQIASVLLSLSGCQVATDQYVTGSATGAISFGGGVALDTACGIASGQPRVAQGGDVKRLLFKGQVVQRTIPLGIFQII
jgi:hypothetical protein